MEATRQDEGERESVLLGCFSSRRKKDGARSFQRFRELRANAFHLAFFGNSPSSLHLFLSRKLLLSSAPIPSDHLPLLLDPSTLLHQTHLPALPPQRVDRSRPPAPPPPQLLPRSVSQQRISLALPPPSPTLPTQLPSSRVQDQSRLEDSSRSISLIIMNRSCRRIIRSRTQRESSSHLFRRWTRRLLLLGEGM